MIRVVLTDVIISISIYSYFFFNDTATTEIYTYGHTRSLHDALPICDLLSRRGQDGQAAQPFEAVAQLTRIAHADRIAGKTFDRLADRSEEHTSELQSLMRISYAVFCLQKKKMSRLKNSVTIRNENQLSKQTTIIILSYANYLP